MKKKILSILALLLVAVSGAWADGRVVIAQLQNGSITAGEVPGSGDVTVTLTVTPDADFFITAQDIMVVKTTGKAMAPHRIPGYAKDITVSEVSVDERGKGTYTFMLPDGYGAYVKATFTPISENLYDMAVWDEATGKKLDGVKVLIEINDPVTKTVTITDIIMPQSYGDDQLIVRIPENIGGYKVTELGAGIMNGKNNVTDVYLPQTARPLVINENALPGTARIHSPLELLDDYALMTSLKTNYEGLKISATVTPVNRLWTFSSGVDCILPKGVIAFTAYISDDKVPHIADIEEENLLLADGRRGIKANNGVLIACSNGKGGDAYEIVASPGNQPSGTKPATTDARSYQNNQLEPVIEAKNYAAGEYLVMKDNKFHSIAANNSMVKACKAVLRMKK